MMRTVDDYGESTGKEGKINEEECITKPESDRDSLLPTPVTFSPGYQDLRKKPCKSVTQ